MLFFSRLEKRNTSQKSTLQKHTGEFHCQRVKKENSVFYDSRALSVRLKAFWNRETGLAVFAKLMRQVMEEILDVQHYHDDGLVTSATWEDHLTSLSQLYGQIQATGLTM